MKSLNMVTQNSILKKKEHFFKPTQNVISFIYLRRLMTGSQGGGGGEARPMTSVSGAGYHGSSKDSGNRAFDPLNIGKGPAPPLAEKSENSHEDKAKEMEKVSGK